MKKITIILLVLLGLQTQAQINPCDSVEYAITSTPNNNVLQLEGWVNGVCPVNFPCTVSDYSWTVCDENLCYGDTGHTVYFQQFMTTDTIKVCLNTTMTLNGGMTYTCIQCDSLVFGPNGWMVMMMGNPTAIREIQLNTAVDNEIYDLLGKKLKFIPIGKMYIRNNKLYMQK